MNYASKIIVDSNNTSHKDVLLERKKTLNLEKPIHPLIILIIHLAAVPATPDAHISTEIENPAVFSVDTSGIV